jgi:hypothetical protein
MSIDTQIFPSTAGDEARVGDGRARALYNVVLLSKPALWKAERDADGSVDAHSALRYGERMRSPGAKQETANREV